MPERNRIFLFLAAGGTGLVVGSLFFLVVLGMIYLTRWVYHLFGLK
ncbi:MAG: hypothetical protein V2G33_05165 [bacterium JZ-2024 1]